MIETLDDVKLFYWKRFKRFYIPYLVCLTVLFLGGWFESGKQFVLSLIGLSTYIGSSPNTVWYFSMLMSFYALTPILLYLKKRNHFYFYALTFGLICLYVLFSRINGMYFPFYLLGILITDKRLKVLTSKWIYIITFMISFILLLYVQDKWGGLLICRYFLIFCGIFLIVKLSQSLCCNASLKFWNLLAYSSMMAYLYHRIHYKIIGFIISPDGITSIILFAIMGVISLFLISYWLQKYMIIFPVNIWDKTKLLIMIHTRKDLQEYLSADKAAMGFGKGRRSIWKECLKGNIEDVFLMRFICSMRKYEYVFNNYKNGDSVGKLFTCYISIAISENV